MFDQTDCVALQRIVCVKLIFIDSLYIQMFIMCVIYISQSHDFEDK